ncbi:hypothetical protein DMZ48_13780 [Robertkochia solimangrovi]|nr:hypothetical protein DMZ48_13780 [Robertkochia solimangrovi]
MVSCKEQPKAPEKTEEQQVSQRIEKEDVDILITPPTAREMQQRYLATRSNLFLDRYGYWDASDFTMKISELREYLDYVEQELGANYSDESKIFVFLGVTDYLDDKGDVVDNEKYPMGSTTIFLAPYHSRDGSFDYETLDTTQKSYNKRQEGNILSFIAKPAYASDIEPADKAGQGHPPTIY